MRAITHGHTQRANGADFAFVYVSTYERVLSVFASHLPGILCRLMTCGPASSVEGDADLAVIGAPARPYQLATNRAVI